MESKTVIKASPKIKKEKLSSQPSIGKDEPDKTKGVKDKTSKKTVINVRPELAKDAKVKSVLNKQKEDDKLKKEKIKKMEVKLQKAEISGDIKGKVKPGTVSNLSGTSKKRGDDINQAEGVKAKSKEPPSNKKMKKDEEDMIKSKKVIKHKTQPEQRLSSEYSESDSEKREPKKKVFHFNLPGFGSSKKSDMEVDEPMSDKEKAKTLPQASAKVETQDKQRSLKRLPKDIFLEGPSPPKAKVITDVTLTQKDVKLGKKRKTKKTKKSSASSTSSTSSESDSEQRDKKKSGFHFGFSGFGFSSKVSDKKPESDVEMKDTSLSMPKVKVDVEKRKATSDVESKKVIDKQEKQKQKKMKKKDKKKMKKEAATAATTSTSSSASTSSDEESKDKTKQSGFHIGFPGFGFSKSPSKGESDTDSKDKKEIETKVKVFKQLPKDLFLESGKKYKTYNTSLDDSVLSPPKDTTVPFAKTKIANIKYSTISDPTVVGGSVEMQDPKVKNKTSNFSFNLFRIRKSGAISEPEGKTKKVVPETKSSDELKSGVDLIKVKKGASIDLDDSIKKEVKTEKPDKSKISITYPKLWPPKYSMDSSQSKPDDLEVDPNVSGKSFKPRKDIELEIKKPELRKDVSLEGVEIKDKSKKVREIKAEEPKQKDFKIKEPKIKEMKIKDGKGRAKTKEPNEWDMFCEEMTKLEKGKTFYAFIY